MHIVRAHLDYLESSIADIDRVDSMVRKQESAIWVNCNSVITILSEIGIDMTQFGSSKRPYYWSGLTPSNNESADKKKSVRITRVGVYLKPALMQVAHAAVKSNDFPYFRLKFEQISKCRGKKRAIIAIARMTLTATFAMLTTGEVFNPCDLYKVEMP